MKKPQANRRQTNEQCLFSRKRLPPSVACLFILRSIASSLQAGETRPPSPSIVTSGFIDRRSFLRGICTHSSRHSYYLYDTCSGIHWEHPRTPTNLDKDHSGIPRSPSHRSCRYTPTRSSIPSWSTCRRSDRRCRLDIPDPETKPEPGPCTMVRSTCSCRQSGRPMDTCNGRCTNQWARTRTA